MLGSLLHTLKECFGEGRIHLQLSRECERKRTGRASPQLNLSSFAPHVQLCSAHFSLLKFPLSPRRRVRERLLGNVDDTSMLDRAGDTELFRTQNFIALCYPAALLFSERGVVVYWCAENRIISFVHILFTTLELAASTISCFSFDRSLPQPIPYV